MSMTPEEQIEVIKARSEGKTIECSLRGQSWSTSMIYDFNFTVFDYRVAKKPDVVRCVNATVDFSYAIAPNLKLTFDGETGKLKSAEVL